MAVFSVLEPIPTGDLRHDAERIVLVREGFSWFAFLVPLVWLLVHRLWLALVLFIAASFAVQAAGSAVGGPAAALGELGLCLIFGFEANAIRRWTLTRRGLRFSAVVAGANRDECERRFFATWLVGHALERDRPASVAARPAKTPVAAPASDPVIGLFPSSERPQ